MASSKNRFRGAGAGTSSGKAFHSEVVDLTIGDAGGSRRKRTRNYSVTSSVIIDIDDDQDSESSAVLNGKGSGKRSKNSGPSQKLQSKGTPAKSLLASSKNHSVANGFELYPFSANEYGPQAGDLSFKYSDHYNSYSNGGYSETEKMDYKFISESYNSEYQPFSNEVDAATSSPWMDLSSPLLQTVHGSLASMLPCSPISLTDLASSRLDVRRSSRHSDQSCSSKQKKEKGIDSEIDEDFESFKHFNTVTGCSDHHFSKHGAATISQSKKATKWSKTIQHEWKLLEDHLPESIFVRVYEERIDLMRAVIIGAAGTPYHDGLFFLDIMFPSNYPLSPPQVHYHSGGLRLNPNLYNCGKVCLSLLNTWTGSKAEMWTPGKSTMLQVLLSIQALVLNAKPYFNEPGYAASAGHPEGEMKSENYSENTFILSCKTMIYSIKRPPKHFESFVMGHFRHLALPILDACKAYMDGAQVGTLTSGGIQDVDEGDKSCSAKFRASVGQVLPLLVEAFSDKGFNCKKYADTTKYPKPITSAGACVPPGHRMNKTAPQLNNSWHY